MNLKRVRLIKGLNQYDLALKTGISQSQISLIENGYRNPKEDEKRKIAKALGCCVEEVFSQKGVRGKNHSSITEREVES